VIASLKRWMVRDVLGQAMSPFVEEFIATDDKTFVLRLKQPFGFVETALAISAGTAPVIMREKDALTDPYKYINETIGSGPFKFITAEWNPGAKTVYEKNKDYVPRSEPPDGTAGGKIAKVDRVEWIVLPDPFTKSSAIQRGEVDIIDQLPNDQIPVLEKSPGIVLDRTSFLAAIGYYPAEPPLSTLRQPEGPPSARAGGRPGGISQRRLWRRALVAPMLLVLRLRQPERDRGRVRALSETRPGARQGIARGSGLQG
jgi:ABC-type transport system substrate-binding protein